jgi:hypothetical protein
MDEQKKFILVESIIFAILGAITLLEIFNYMLFKEFFMRIQEYLSWFLGLSVATVVPEWVSRFKSQIDRMTGRFLPNERFVFFIVNLFFVTAVVGLSKQLSIFFLKRYFEFFHLIFTQWLVVIYMWFKLEHGFRINVKYVVGAEIFVILFSAIITLTL